MAGLITSSMAFALMQTFLIPALPRLETDLHTSTTWVTWTVTAYLLTGSVATPLIGKLGDQHGKVRMMLVALALFLVGSIGAIVAWNVGSLIVFRAIQGVGGAVFPLSYAIIRDEFPPQRVGVAMGLVSAVLGVGGGLGIVASGLILDHASWRWLFVVSAAIVAVALVLVWRFVPESPIKTPSRVDVPGSVAFSGAMVALLLGLTEGDGWGWLSGRTLGLFLAAIALFVVWVAIELRVAQPLVDMRMFVQRPVLVTNAAALIAGFALFGAFVLLPVFMQTQVAAHLGYGFGASVTKTGVYLIPSSFTILFAGPLAGWIGRWTSMKWPLSVGLLLVAATCVSFAMWHSRPWQIAVQQGVMGIGVGFAFAAMATLITQAVRISETGVATGMNTVMRTVGSVVGAQLGAALLAAYVVGSAKEPSVTGFEVMFWIAGGVAALGAVLSIFVTPTGLRRRRRDPVLAAAD
jgi:EmrB/QacA subfamily drug resistance transporter